MSKKQKRKLIEIESPSFDRNSKWLVGFDDTVRVLEPHLEELGFRLLKVDIELEREEIFEFLQKSEVNFYVTAKPKGRMRYFHGAWPRPDYHLRIRLGLQE